MTILYYPPGVCQQLRDFLSENTSHLKCESLQKPSKRATYHYQTAIDAISDKRISESQRRAERGRTFEIVNYDTLVHFGVPESLIEMKYQHPHADACDVDIKVLDYFFHCKGSLRERFKEDENNAVKFKVIYPDTRQIICTHKENDHKSDNHIHNVRESVAYLGAVNDVISIMTLDYDFIIEDLIALVKGEPVPETHTNEFLTF